VLFEEQAYKDLLPKLARRAVRTEGITVRSTLARRDGSPLEAEVSVRLLVGAESRPLGFMMVVRDVTAQMRTETELRESEQRYRGLIEGLSEGLLIVREGTVVYANAAAARLCGQDAESLVGAAWRDRVSTQDVLRVEEVLGAVERGEGGGSEATCTLIAANGAFRAEVSLRAREVDFEGRPAVLLMLRDQTSTRRTEGELRRNEARLDAVLEGTSDGVLVLSGDGIGGQVQMTNRAFTEMFGLATEEVLGASKDRLLTLLRNRGHGAASVADYIAGNQTVVPGDMLKLQGDPVRELQVSMTALTGHAGEDLGRVLTCRDLSEQRRSERELLRQAEELRRSKVELEHSYRRLNEVNEQLGSRGDELDRLNQELRRLDRMKSDLLGNVSHELQTPLVSIRGYTEMILKERLGPISEEQRKGLSLSLKNIDRLISMIDNLLAFTRTDPGLRELKLSRFPLVPLVEEAAELLRENAAAKRIELALSIENPELSIEADRDKILQVLLNLLTNAIKFSRVGSKVEVAAGTGRTGFAEVRVVDEGVGIPEDALGRIFDRYYRVERPDEPAEEGSGLGLAIVRDILRVHGCTIHVRSDEGKGTEFAFTLPLAEEQSEPPSGDDAGGEEPPREPDPGDTTDPAERKLRIIRRFNSDS